MKFDGISGNQIQAKLLKKTIDSGKISHFYLFEGERGTGKRELALAFSKAILCKSDRDRPCDKCPSCIKFNTENHPDFKMLVANKDFIRKEDVEDMIDDISILPFESGKKVFLIEDLDLARVETQNLLLKTLEEPPGYVVIIIITSNANQILPTIRSRCQSLKFHNKEKMQDIREIEAYDELRDEIIKIIHNLLKGNKIRAFSSMDFFVKNKDISSELLDIMLYWFRDLAIYKETGEKELLLNKDKLDILEKQSSLDINHIYDIIDRIERTKINISRNINYNLSIETMLLNI